MAGLLSGQLQGLLGGMSAGERFRLGMLTGGDPARAIELLMMQQQMEHQKGLLGREKWTDDWAQSMASLPTEERLKYETPEAQLSIRASATAHGNPERMEMGGLLQGPQEKLPREAQLFALAQQDPAFAKFLQARQPQGMNMAPANVQEWQFFNTLPPEQQKAYMEMKRGGYDTSVIQAAAEAKAAGGVLGTAQGTGVKNAPNLLNTAGEVEGIAAPGGLLDKATGSGAGALADRLAGFVGVSTEGAEAIAALKPIADLVLKQVPRFEGPQSDKDTQSYHEAAGQLADPRIPVEQKKAAAAVIIRLMRERAGQFIQTDGMTYPSPNSSPAQGGVVNWSDL